MTWLGLFLLAPGIALGQENSAPRGEISLEVLKVHFPKGSESSLSYLEDASFSSVITISGRFRFSKDFSVVAEVPLSHANGKTNGCVDAYCEVGVSRTVLNNPYLGLDWQTPMTGVELSFGIRPGIQTANRLHNGGDWDKRWGGLATEIGVFGDQINRVEAYLPKVTSGSAALSYRTRLFPTLSLIAFTRYVAMYQPDAEGYVHGPNGDKNAHHLHSGGDLALSIDNWSVGGGVHARDYRSAEYLSDRVFYQAELNASLGFRSIRIHGQFRYPFGNERSRLWVDRSMQFGVAYDLQ
jgi:hypothetical protein